MMKRGTRWTISIFILLAAGLAASCGRNALRDYILNYTGFDGSIYVDGSRGNDANVGTIEEPLATIREGLVRGAWFKDHGVDTAISVRVAEGSYPQHDAIGESITLVEGVSLYGGYSSDFGSRDPSVYVTLINDASSSGDDIATVRAENGITTDTVVDGFNIVGGAAAAGGIDRAIHIDAASPTISNNVISAGNAFIALDIYRDSDPDVRDNEIYGSDEDLSWKTAVLVYDNSLAELRDNVIDGGNNGNCIAVQFGDTRCYVFRDNQVYAGDGEVTTGISIGENSNVTLETSTIDATGAAGGESFGIRVTGSSSLSAYGNTISASGDPAETNAYGISLEEASWSNLEGNTIQSNDAAGTCGIDIYDSTSDYASIGRNFISCSGSAGESYGVRVEGGECIVSDNVINPGTGTLSVGLSLDSLAGNPNVINNTISGGSGTGMAMAVKISDCEPLFYNNILFTTGGADETAIYEWDATAGFVFLYYNCFYDYTGFMVFYHDYGDPPSDISTAAGVNGLSGNTSSNIEADPDFSDEDGSDGNINTQSDNLWSLSASSPSSVTEGGLFMEAGDTDILDEVRTEPISMGAYEYFAP